MISEVKLYDSYGNLVLPGDPEQLSMFVLATDYAALEAENARLERSVSHWQGLAVANRKVADDALAQLAAIQPAKGEGMDTPWPDFNLDGEPYYGEETVNKLVAQHQRITAAMAAEVERWERNFRDIHEPALRDAHAYIQELRAELAEVKGREAVPVLVAYECCHCGAPTEAPKPFSAFVVCPACGEKTAATRAARYAPASPDVEGLVKALEAEFPLLDDNGLDETLHHCEWAIQQERKRLHAALSTWRQGQGSATTAPQNPASDPS